MNFPLRIVVEESDFDLNQEMQAMRARSRDIGALVSFVGVVRDLNEGAQVATMTLEHYPGMTEKALSEIAQTATKRWPLQDCTIIHRVGPLLPSDQIVLVLVASRHRADAFEACHFIMDYLKTRAPFWKKEATPTGDRWVDARESDTIASARWGDSFPA